MSMVMAIIADADLVFADQYENLVAAIQTPEEFWTLIGLFQRATDKGNPATHFNLGRAIALVEGYEGEALAAFEQAITMQPWLGSPYVGAGIVLLRIGEIEQAITIFQQARTLDFPEWPEDEWLKNTTAYHRAHAYLGLAVAYNSSGRFLESVESAYEALTLSAETFNEYAEQLLNTYAMVATAWLSEDDPDHAYDLTSRAVPLAEYRGDNRIFELLNQAEAMLESQQ